MQLNRKIGIGLFIFSVLLYFTFIPLIPTEVWSEEKAGLSPRSFPKLIAWILGMLSVWMIVLPPGAKSIIEGKSFLRSGITVGIVLIYLYLMEKFGYILPSMAALFSLMYFYGAKNKVVTIIISITIPIIFYLFFYRVFGTRFPQGVFF